MEAVTQKVQKAAESFAKTILKKPGQLFRHAFTYVVRHLVKNAQSITRPQLEKLKQEVQKLDLVIAQREFVKKYKVQVLGDGKVQLTLPKGTSRLDLLKEAQALAPQLVGQPAIYSQQLEEWTNDAAFTSSVDKDTTMAIDGNVRGSTRKNRQEQESEGWNNVDLCDLAVAHSAYFIAKKEDLFGRKWVRARGGALGFDDDGLDILDYADDDRVSRIAASASLPSRN